MKKSTLFNTFVTTVFLVIGNQASGLTDETELICAGNPIDIVFVLDSSKSIYNMDFNTQLEFVSFIVNHSDIGLGPTQVRVGVITFGDKAVIKINLKESVNKKELNEKIGKISQVDGEGNSPDALRTMRNAMFQREQGGRSGVKRIAIILTDGYSTNPNASRIEAEACRGEGIELFVIGIGSSVFFTELWVIVNKPSTKFLFIASDSETLKTIRKKVAQLACKKSGF